MRTKKNAEEDADELKFRTVYGGNSGYVGYSKSKRAAEAEERGLRSVSQMDKEFADEVNRLVSEATGEESNLSLKKIRDIAKSGRYEEWHHTSMYGNRTKYYSADTIAESIVDGIEEENGREEREREMQKVKEREERLKELMTDEHDVTITVRDSDGDSLDFTYDVFRSSNGYAFPVKYNLTPLKASFGIQILNEGQDKYRGVSPYLQDSYIDDHWDEIEDAVDEYNARLAEANEEVDTAKFSFIGEKGAKTADHAEEVTTRLDNLAVAREMEEAKKDAKTIKMATGWERGADGKWRYEIPDFTIKAPEEWIKKKELKLSDVIDGDNDIFKAYPEAKDIVFKKGRSKSGGWYNDGVIEVGLGDLREAMRWHPGVGVEFEKKWIRRTLLHEVQHYIQEKEGFAQGGNSNMTIDPTFDEKMQQIVAEEKQVLDEWKALPSSEKETPSRMSPRATEIYRRYNDVQARGNALRKNAKIGKDGYRRLAGEVESRNVEERSKMTPEERRASLTSETEDVAREDQIFLFGEGGESHMGSRTNKNMAKIGKYFDGRNMSNAN